MKKLLLIMFFAFAGFASFAKESKPKQVQQPKAITLQNAQWVSTWCGALVCVDLQGGSWTPVLFEIVNRYGCGGNGPCC